MAELTFRVVYVYKIGFHRTYLTLQVESKVVSFEKSALKFARCYEQIRFFYLNHSNECYGRNDITEFKIYIMYFVTK